ncbi:hypothetical protein CRYUN_Cryun25bG0003100 [Craigia yunnanensis]
MTTAARPTWQPAKGGNEQGGTRIFGPSQKYSSRDIASHTTLKPRLILENLHNQNPTSRHKRMGRTLRMSCRRETSVMSLKSGGISHQITSPIMMTEIVGRETIFFWKGQRGRLKTELFHAVLMLMILMWKSTVTMKGSTPYLYLCFFRLAQLITLMIEFFKFFGWFRRLSLTYGT